MYDLREANTPDKPVDLTQQNRILDTIRHPKGTVTVGIVGKYVQHQDAYKSIFEALDHGAIAAGYKIQFKRFEADKIEDNGTSRSRSKDATDIWFREVLVNGGGTGRFLPLSTVGKIRSPILGSA